MDRPPRERLRDIALAGLACTLVAWVATGPRLLAYLNWDQSTYIAGIASGKLGWSAEPWNAHFGIGQVYWLGAKLVGALGGTVIDAFRVVDALCFGVSGAIVWALLLELARSRALAALLLGVWATSWVNAIFLLTLEDNLLYTPAICALVWMFVRRADAWGWRESVAAGVLVGGAALMSWQALLWLGPPVWAAIWSSPPGRRRAARALLPFAVLGAFAATLVAWCGLVAATSTLTWKGLLAGLFSKPSGNFTLRGPAQWREVLETLGHGLSYLLRFDYLHSVAAPHHVLVWATGALALLIALFVWATRDSLTRRALLPHLLAASLLLFTVVIPIYWDQAWRVTIRFDYVALLVLPLVALVLGRRPAGDGARRIASVALALLIALQITMAARWDGSMHAWYPALPRWTGKLPPESAYGRDHKSWYQFFHDVRRSQPRACRYVFLGEEINAGWWQFDIMAALFSELPEHLILGDPDSMRRWRFPPHGLLRVEDAEHRGLLGECAWLSPDARDLVAERRALRP